MTLRLEHIVEWDRSGQSCIALIRGADVVARFSNWSDARIAYKQAQREQINGDSTHLGD
jgi:hypothetical protein